MDRPLVAVVMAGGTGTRLYPASRRHRPKQFLSFGSDRSLLERTIDRLEFADDVIVSTQAAFADDVQEHIAEESVIVEPEGKDTGPALLYATHVVDTRYDDPVVLCVPSDHVIEGDFEAVARRTAEVAIETGGLVTIGIEPQEPDTGYGYIQPGKERGGYAPVDAFHEKPDRDTAAHYVDEGYYWNAGIFAWTPATLRREARDTPLDPLLEALAEDEPEAGFSVVESISVDRAVMERSADVYVVPGAFAWDDLGSWDAVARVFGEELAASLQLDTDGVVVAGDDVHVTAIGVSDLVIAAYDDRILVVPTDETQRVRDAVDELQENGLF